MSMQKVADGLERLARWLSRRPEAGLMADTPASAHWAGTGQPLRVVCRHPLGHEFVTDMPAELGGSGDQVSPGWLYRAGMAACAATSLVMLAATEGLVLTALDVQATSRSDARGLLALPGDQPGDHPGRPVDPGPMDQQLRVRIAAPGSSFEELEAFVHRALQRSPIPCVAMARGLVVEVDVNPVAG